MELYTQRLVLRPWTEEDAESLFEYAKDPEVGPIAGWPAHQSVLESLDIIKNVLNGALCFAICEKGKDKAIGAVELKLNGHTDMTQKDDECELGYWLGKPFWGRGYMPEAVREIIRYGFEEYGMNTVWCGYYDGNEKSKRVQEKVGFVYHHTCKDVPVPLMHETRVGHTNYMTKKQWIAFGLESEMWKAAQNRNKEHFLNIVSEDAVMVCGGYRCTGKEYADVIEMFDCKSHNIFNFELVNEDESSFQVHYMLHMEVRDPKNADLAGTFHITTTWKCINGTWKVVFNMDQRVEGWE